MRESQLKSHGIRVLTSCPGIVATDFQRRASEGDGGQSTISPMSVEFAANEIWKQIQNEKPLHIFDWRYRLLTFLGHYFVPKRISIKILMGIMGKRYSTRRKILKK